PTIEQIEAALHGDAVGPSAEYWREVRADVRALAPPLPPELEQRLREQIEQRARPGQSAPRRGLRPRGAVARARGWLAKGWQRPALAGIGIALLAAIVTLALVGPWSTRPQLSEKMSRGRLDAATERSA